MAHQHDCICPVHSSGTSQTIQELEFSRGIWSAALDGDISRVEKFIVDTHPDIKDSAGYTALHYAARQGHKKICQILLQAGAAVNIQTPGGVTPLHRASYSGHKDIVLLLIEFGADPSIVDHDGMTSLHKAVQNGHQDIVRILLRTSKVLLQVKDKRGRVPLDLVQDNNTELKQLLTLTS